MKIIELKKDSLNEIEDLWRELNSLHEELSSNFKSHFEVFTFHKRSSQLLKKEYMSILVAMVEKQKVGYCIVTKDKEVGEIDSIYISPVHQGQGIGDELMRKALNCLRELKCEIIRVYVAEGNETVFSFYEKYGFKNRFTVLQMA